eukprot:TRINITY_DN5223_c0_g1_i2.p1 TRINITY_DN5223_c0_g1~~TRINITY_DN5223_c0_g1_i2.p1  ORF type:complete len:502 (-),score=95.97 TRINITY_DN5223_c0_g1_i2:91-1596(-)
MDKSPSEILLPKRKRKQSVVQKMAKLKKKSKKEKKKDKSGVQVVSVSDTSLVKTKVTNRPNRQGSRFKRNGNDVKMLPEDTPNLEIEDEYNYDSRITQDWDVHISNTPDDNDHDIRYKISENGEKTISAATFNELVKKLISPQIDMEYQEIFWFSYKCFAPTSMVLLKIRERLEDIDHNNPHTMSVKLRCFGILTTLVENNFEDFSDPMIKSVQDLIEEYKIYNKILAEKLERVLMNKMLGFNPVSIESHIKYPSPILPKIDEFELLDISPIEMARQLTLFDYSIFKHIRKSEFINQAWNKEQRKAPYLVLLIKRFNELNTYVTLSILREFDIRKRAKIFSHWILIAKQLFELKNYNSTASIIASLKNASIHRLKKTKARCKHLDTLKDLDSKLTPFDGYAVYKELIKHSAPPCIPHVGIYLTDLTYMNEAEDIIENRLINFGKLRKIYEIVHTYLQYQSTPYYFEEVDILQEFIINEIDLTAGIDEDSAFALSLEVEPRD